MYIANSASIGARIVSCHLSGESNQQLRYLSRRRRAKRWRPSQARRVVGRRDDAEASESCSVFPRSHFQFDAGDHKSMGADSINSSTTAAMPEVEKDLKIPRHIAVIIDGNRRYGKNKYGSGTRGHSDGTKTVMNFTDWCIDTGVEALTVFAFSTENWKREKAEIDALMKLVDGFIHDILGEALTRNIRVRVLASDSSKLPAFLVKSIKEVEAKTQHCNAFHLNLCVSYGARDEIVGACKKIAAEVAGGETSIDDIDEELLSQRMLTAGLPDPDILLRTSGELRISNFLLFQIAYAELIFMDKLWPEVTREDLQDIIVEFNRRKRRFGK